MLSGKILADYLAELLVANEVTDVVLSPGSRNAPLIMAFNRHQALNCFVIVDERSAAYFALGLAQQSRKPVALACTSGTAPLNYGPALAEAYYQQVPLVAITADRPPELIDQGDGQSIRQENVFGNYVRYSANLASEPYTPTKLQISVSQINEALRLCQDECPGPVHINIPFSEPLYSENDSESSLPNQTKHYSLPVLLPENQLKELQNIWNQCKSKLVIAGLNFPNAELNNLLNRLSFDPSVVILTETTSNLQGEHFFTCIDRLIDGISESDLHLYRPDILITFGGNVVSRKVKAFLKKNKPVHHWNVSGSFPIDDASHSLNKIIPVSPLHFFNAFLEGVIQVESKFRLNWNNRHFFTGQLHDKFIGNCQFSDLKAFSQIVKFIPANFSVQWGNSSPVRYGMLFQNKNGLKHFANRGTSGIDGCLSAAMGAAWKTQSPTLLIIGDLSFFYDSNGLWNKYISDQLRIIVMNNGGGNIFRIIEGPSSVPELENFFETPGHPEIRLLAELYGLPYVKAESEQELELVLPQFFDLSVGKCTLLEIVTPNKINASVLKSYFNFLKS